MGVNLFFWLFLAVMGAVLWYGWAGEKKRREALQRVAGQLGFVYKGDADLAVLGAAHGLRLFSLGSRQTISNLMERQDSDSRSAVFDYRYTTGSGKRRHSTRVTVFLLEKPGMLLPRFYLRPENIFHKLGAAMGYQDFDFTGNPIFSKQYLLQGDNELAVRGLFQPSIVSFFEQNPGWQVEGAGTSLILCRELQCIPVEKMPDFIQQTARLAALFQTH